MDFNLLDDQMRILHMYSLVFDFEMLKYLYTLTTDRFKDILKKHVHPNLKKFFRVGEAQ